MAGRFKKQFLAGAAVGVVIIAAVVLGLHIYGFPRSADAPVELASNGSEGTAQPPNEPSGEKDRPAEPPELVLHASLAGSWYPADAETLRKQLAGFFEKADVKPIDNVIGLVLPHAGYSFSGQTAAMALATINKKYKRIIVIGPAHRMYMEEILSVPRATHFQTPLGRIALDTEFINRVLKYPLFQNVPRALDGENSVEMEIPLLQYKFQDFKLVPIVTGSCSSETINKAGAILKSLIDEETLVVASSDFVHYGAGYKYVPFTKDIPEQIKKLDMGAYEHIAKLDSKGFLQYKQKTGATICGYIPVAILLSMLDAPAKAELIKYATSGELTGDFSNSVSYLSIVFSGAWKEYLQIEPETNAPQLTEEDKKGLLTLARKTISYGLEHQRAPEVSELGVTISEAMKPPRAAFVTLKRNGRLRGCIGDIFPRQPLYKSVLTNAINAAFRDQRFPTLQKDELEDITIEISALTPPAPVSSCDRIRIGTDGVVLRKAGRSAVFLPQVAGEQGWDLNQTLTQLSLKAQLKADDWKEGASFLVFQADVFGESEK
ncbi:MAG: AmmeMemoRadiSam system protein B [Planctomycetes bacterium]|nr:AmmeMemoRadiSam system protein B [Planctomycetota bacterium]